MDYKAKQKMNMRNKLLLSIAEYIMNAVQWIGTHSENYAEYMYKAEALIEFLEILDCGSVGGHDKDNPMVTVTRNRIADRFLTLVNKEASTNTFHKGWNESELQRYNKAFDVLKNINRMTR